MSHPVPNPNRGASDEPGRAGPTGAGTLCHLGPRGLRESSRPNFRPAQHLDYNEEVADLGLNDLWNRRRQHVGTNPKSKKRESRIGGTDMQPLVETFANQFPGRDYEIEITCPE